MYGRMTTLRRLKEDRDNPAKHPFRRMQADRAIKKIMAQMRDRKLMHLRERLIRATLYGDLYWQWKIENLIRAHEKDMEAIDNHFYTKRDEDE